MAIVLVACLMILGGEAAMAQKEPPVRAPAAAPAGSSAVMAAPADSLASARAAQATVPLARASPLAVLARFEEAWRDGALDTVLACLSTNSIEIAIHEAGPPGGHFPPNQAGFLIRDLLHYGGPQQFRVVRFEWKEDELPHGEVEWVHQMAGDEVHERLDIALAREAEGWRIVRVVTR